MKQIRRSVSLLLALIMAFGMVTIPVSAGDPPQYSVSYTVSAADTDLSYADELGQDFRTWLQYDPRWGSLPLGTGSGTSTVGEEGCTITSITKLIIEAGLASPQELNPGILVRYLNANGGFVTSGRDIGAVNWAVVSTFCKKVLGKDFAFIDNRFQSGTLSAVDAAYKAKIIGWLRDGYHLVLGVGLSSVTHWIAVDEYATLSADNTDGEIYIMDSWITDGTERHDISLADYISRHYAGTTTFYRIAAYQTDPTDTDNKDPDLYNTDDYRAYSRFDSRWANTIVGYPVASGTAEAEAIKAELMGNLGQAQMAFTKAMIQAGVLNSTDTPEDAMALLQDNGLITMVHPDLSGVISWGSLDTLDGISASTLGTSAVSASSLPVSTVISDLQAGKHYVLRLSMTSTDEYSWLAVDEPMTMATGELYVLASSGDLDKNSGSLNLSDAMNALDTSRLQRVHTFTTAAPDYVQVSYSADENTASIEASYTIGNDIIPVTSGQYVPAGQDVIVTAVPKEGYASVALTGADLTAGANNTYTFTASADTTLNGEALPQAYPVTYSETTDTCGFTYGDKETFVDYGDTADFTVTPVNDSYTVHVTAKDTAENELTVTQDGTHYSFTQPIGGATVTVTADTPTHTVYLKTDNNNADYTNGAAWYAYTWTGDSYAPKWIRGTLTPEGYYSFDGVESKLIFVRANSSWTEGFTFNDRNFFYNKTDDMYYGSGSSNYNDSKNLFTITSWNGSSYGNMGGTWSEMSGTNTVYLYPKALDVHAAYVVNGSGDKSIYDVYTNYPADYYSIVAKQYYAYTRAAGSSVYTWVKGTADSNGVIKFEGVKDKVAFYRIDPETQPDTTTAGKKNITGDEVWGYTEEKDVDTSGDQMFILNRYQYANESGYTTTKEKMLFTLQSDLYSRINDVDRYCAENGIDTKYAYKYWTKTDARWNNVTMGDGRTDDTDITGKSTLSQSLAKLVVQAQSKPNWDVTDATVKAVNSSGVHTWASDYTKLGLTLDSANSKTSGSATVDVDSSKALAIYNLLLEGKHILLRCQSESGEYVVVDEEKTLLENTDTSNIKIYVLRSSDDMSANVGGIISSTVSGAAFTKYARMLVYTGGTTPGLTRDFDYRRWSIYDGRWDTHSVGKNHTMRNNGACITAVAKLFIQAAVLSDDDNGNHIYDNDFDRNTLTGDFSPDDLRYFLDNNNGLVKNDSSGDGALIWNKVNDFVQHTLEFDTSYQSDNNGLIYLKFAESINNRSDYRMISDAYDGTGVYSSTNEMETLYQAMLQGYHMLIEVKFNGRNKQSWVVVDEKASLESGNIIIMDSSDCYANNADVALDQKYDYFYRVVGYKGATTPLPENDPKLDDETVTDEDGTDTTISITSPALRPVVTDNAYLNGSLSRSGSAEIIYNYIYGPEAQIRVSVKGVVKGNTYRFCITDDEKTASEFGQYIDIKATEADILNADIDTEYFSLNTTAPGNTGGTKTIYLAVKNVESKNGVVVESNVLTTSMTYRSYELVTGFGDLSDETIYIYQTANKNDLIHSPFSLLTASADTLVKVADYENGVDFTYHITDSNGHLIALSEISGTPGVYTVTMTAAASSVGTAAIGTQTSPATAIIDPSYSSYKIRVLNAATYIYQYHDRFGEPVTYTEYLDDTLSEDEINGYAGNNHIEGMPQYISDDAAPGNKLISKAPKVESGFNKNLTWTADEQHLDINKSSYSVTLTADEAPTPYTVTFRYDGGYVTKTGVYNTLIQLTGDELPAVNAQGEPFAYWTDDTGRVASVYPSFNMKISENATFTAHYGAPAENVDVEGDGTWESFNDGVKNSYKIEGSNRSAVRTVYTDFSLRFIDGDNRVQDLLNAEENQVLRYGIIVAYDMNDTNNMTDRAQDIKASAQIVANANANNVARGIGSGRIRFFNYSYNTEDTITNRNRVDIGVTWDYDTYHDKNVVGYAYIVYKDSSGTQKTVVSDGVTSVIDWPGTAASGI